MEHLLTILLLQKSWHTYHHPLLVSDLSHTPSGVMWALDRCSCTLVPSTGKSELLWAQLTPKGYGVTDIVAWDGGH